MQAVKDEVIVDLVNQCRSNSKKLMQMLSTTRLVLTKSIPINALMVSCMVLFIYP